MEQQYVYIIECNSWKTAPYGIKDVLIHYHYRSDPKVGPDIVALRKIPCSCHACIIQLSLPWDSKIKYACNHPRHGRVNDEKYSLIIGFHNIWIIMNFLDDKT